MAQNEVLRSAIFYPLLNENKHVVIFRNISIIDNRDQKENFTIAFINEFWRFLKRETPGKCQVKVSSNTIMSSVLEGKIIALSQTSLDIMSDRTPSV